MEYLAALETLQKLLKPLEFVVWGEAAMAQLGAPLLPHNIMLVPSEQSYDIAVAKVKDAGFRETSWSYGSLSPAEIDAGSQSERLREIHATARQHYNMLNLNSTRFEFPQGTFPSLRLLILQPGYVGLSPPCPSTPDGQTSSQNGSAEFTRQGIFFYPGVSTLLGSFIRTMLKDVRGNWYLTLHVWITTYICMFLHVKPDLMDNFEDADVKETFSQLIKRDSITRWDRNRKP